MQFCFNRMKNKDLTEAENSLSTLEISSRYKYLDKQK